jgi:hypothetical protein
MSEEDKVTRESESLQKDELIGQLRSEVAEMEKKIQPEAQKIDEMVKNMESQTLINK